MRKGKLTLAALTVLFSIVGALSGPARAAVSYSYVSGQPLYIASLGGTVTVNLYLKETLTGGSTSFIASDGGLSGFGVEVNRMPNGGQPVPVIQDAQANMVDFPQFSSTPTYTMFTADTAQLTGAIALGAAGVLDGSTGGGAAPSIPGEIYLGRLTIRAGFPTTYTVGAIDPINGGNTVTKNNVFDLDLAEYGDGTPTSLFTGVGTSVSTFMVNIPEPDALGAFACCGGLLAVRRRRSAASHLNA